MQIFSSIKQKFRIGVQHRVPLDEQQSSPDIAERVKVQLSEQLGAALVQNETLFNSESNSATGDTTVTLDLVVIPLHMFDQIMNTVCEEYLKDNLFNKRTEETPSRHAEDCERICAAILNGSYTNGSQAMLAVMKLYSPDPDYSQGGVALALEKLRNHNW